VTETDLGRFHIDPSDNKGGGVQATQVVEAGALTAGCFGGWEPHPLPPVRVAQRAAIFVREDQGVAFVRREPGPLEVRLQHGDDGGGHEHGALAGLGLRGAEHVAPSDPTDDRLDDGKLSADEVEKLLVARTIFFATRDI
jgi:hypothetical protein